MCWQRRSRFVIPDQCDTKSAAYAHVSQIAAQCMEPLVQVQLFVQLITVLHAFYEDGCEEVSEC